MMPLQVGDVHLRRRTLNHILDIEADFDQARKKLLDTATHVHHRLRAVTVGHVEMLPVLGRKVLIERLHADHRSSLCPEVVADVDDVDHSVSRLQHALLHLVIELKAGVHDGE